MGRRARFTMDEAENIRNDGRTVRAIAEAWGVTRTVIHRIKAGSYRPSDLPSKVTPKEEGATKPQLQPSPEEIEAIRNDLRSLAEIAADYDVSRTTIHRIKNPAPRRKLRMDG